MKILCPICNSTTSPLEAPNDLYLSCTSCRLIHKIRLSHLSKTEEKARYERHENSIEDSGYVAMFERFLEAAVRPLISEGEVLDFGCGPGPVLAVLMRREGFELDVYDPYFSPEKVFAGKKYDLITCTETCEHFRDPLEEFKLMASLLKDGGRIAIQTEFKPEVGEFENWYYKNDPTHVSFYDRQVFDVIAEKVGLVVEFCDGKKYCVLTSSKDVL